MLHNYCPETLARRLNQHEQPYPGPTGAGRRTAGHRREPYFYSCAPWAVSNPRSVVVYNSPSGANPQKPEQPTKQTTQRKQKKKRKTSRLPPHLLPGCPALAMGNKRKTTLAGFSGSRGTPKPFTSARRLPSLPHTHVASLHHPRDRPFTVSRGLIRCTAFSEFIAPMPAPVLTTDSLVLQPNWFPRIYDILSFSPLSFFLLLLFLLPRPAECHFLNPASGLMIFQSDGTSGFYYNSGSPASPVWTIVGTGSGWSLSGNSGTTAVTNFIGTNDNVALAYSGLIIRTPV